LEEFGLGQVGKIYDKLLVPAEIIPKRRSSKLYIRLFEGVVIDNPQNRLCSRKCNEVRWFGNEPS